MFVIQFYTCCALYYLSTFAAQLLSYLLRPNNFRLSHFSSNNQNALKGPAPKMRSDSTSCCDACTKTTNLTVQLLSN